LTMPPPLKNMKGAGWVKRTVIDKPRLSELVALYADLGFEVHVGDFSPDDYPGECSECMAAEPWKYKVIYTRKREKQS